MKRRSIITKLTSKFRGVIMGISSYISLHLTRNNSDDVKISDVPGKDQFDPSIAKLTYQEQVQEYTLQHDFQAMSMRAWQS